MQNLGIRVVLFQDRGTNQCSLDLVKSSNLRVAPSPRSTLSEKREERKGELGVARDETTVIVLQAPGRNEGRERRVVLAILQSLLSFEDQ